MTPSTWHQAIQDCQSQGKGYVLVTLLASAGSTPRNTGTKMVVCADGIFDTIGGGHLEYEVTHLARQLLAEGKQRQHIEHYPLSSKLGQCCGGATNVLFEVMVQHQQHLAIYGAGHVAKALVPILAQLPIQIRWVDPRENLFPQQTASNVSQEVNEFPQDTVNTLPPDSWMLVMTHNHQLDYDLVKKGLELDNVTYLGMIGSDTKAKRFVTRLTHQGLSSKQVEKLTSPVGDLSIPGKAPIEVAVSIAAQLINRLHREEHQENRQDLKKAWLQTKAMIAP